jgi:cyclomaltodextrinase
MMNVASSHDSPRLSTSLYNKTMDKYKAKPSDNPDYKIARPDELTRKEQILLLIHQFTYLGAPQIWNGEEVGMWGADDPDCRKPVIWDDITYENERANYDPEKIRPVDVVLQDTGLFSVYRGLIKMRKENPVLVHGDLSFTIVDDQKMVLAYSRSMKNDEIIVAFNRSNDNQLIKIPVRNDGEYINIFPGGKDSFQSYDKEIGISMLPLTAIVLKKNRK